MCVFMKRYACFIVCLVCGCTLDSRELDLVSPTDKDRELIHHEHAHLVARSSLTLGPWRAIPDDIKVLAQQHTLGVRGERQDALVVSMSGAEGASLARTLEVLIKQSTQHDSYDTLPTSSLPMFPERSRLCITTRDEIYLAHQDNKSPALSLSDPPHSGDSLALFIFDLDAPRSESHSHSSMWRGSAPSWVNSELLPKRTHSSVKRAPFLLWAMNDLSHNLRAIPEGLGGEGVRLRGKMPHRVSIGEAWSNDYSTWFTSQAVAGDYYGYDGPCVAWNDPRPQHRIMALVLSLSHPPSMTRSSQTQLRSGWDLLQMALPIAESYTTGVWLTQEPLDMIQERAIKPSPATPHTPSVPLFE